MTRRPWAQLLWTGMVAVGCWAYIALVLQPANIRELTRAGGTFGPYASDFYSPWFATYAVLRQGRDPYSPAVTADIQRGVFGRVLAPDDPFHITNAFVYPLYTVFILALLVLIPIAILYPLWYGVTGALVAGSVLLWLRALGWRPGPFPMGLLLLLGISTLAATQAILSQQLTVVATVFLAGSLACLVQGRAPAHPWQARLWYAVAGALLALATIKPQLVAGFVLWLGAWALADWRRRGGLLVGFAATLAALLAGAFLLMPGWVGAWRAALADYEGYALQQPLLGLFVPAAGLPWVLGILAAGLVLFAWRTRAAPPGSLAFSLVVALLGIYAVLPLSPGFYYNHLLVYPALVLVLQHRATLRAIGRGGGRVYGATLLLVLAPWLTALGLLAAWLGAGLGDPTIQAAVARVYLLPVLVSLLLPFILLVPLGLLARPALAAEIPR